LLHGASGDPKGKSDTNGTTATTRAKHQGKAVIFSRRAFARSAAIQQNAVSRLTTASECCGFNTRNMLRGKRAGRTKTSVVNGF
jgi:hypothetical protein